MRVLVTAANLPEREGGKQVKALVKQMGDAVSRLHTIWVDGGYDGNPFLRWVIDTCRAHCASCPTSARAPGLCLASVALGGGKNLWLVQLVSATQQGL